jgi:hypothetical protein
MDVPLGDLDVLSELGDALSFPSACSGILWALILGFAISRQRWRQPLGDLSR